MVKKLVKKQPVVKKTLVKTSEKEVLPIEKVQPEKKEKIDFNRLIALAITIPMAGRLGGPVKTEKSDTTKMFVDFPDFENSRFEPSKLNPKGMSLKGSKAYKGYTTINHKDREQKTAYRTMTLSAEQLFMLMQKPTRNYKLDEWKQLSTFRKMLAVVNEYAEPGFEVEVEPIY